MRTIFLIGALSFVLVSCEPATKPETPAPPATPPATGKTEAPKVEASKTEAPKTTGIPGAADLGKAAVSSTLALVKPEIACAHCVYKMAGVTSCQPAVKVAGQTLLLTGAGADAVKGNQEICKGAKPVTLDGKVDGKNYVATKVELGK